MWVERFMGVGLLASGPPWKEEIHTQKERFVQEKSDAALRQNRGNRREAHTYQAIVAAPLGDQPSPDAGAR